MELVWDATGERLWETGVDKVVLFPMISGEYQAGVAWNGVTNITESPSGAEASPFFADNVKYANLFSAEDFGATIEAYMYPDEFADCDGSVELAPGVRIGQQPRKPFGFAYRTLIGNDTENENYGYKIHLVYGAMAAPSEKAHNSVNESPELEPMSWEITTTPVNVAGYKATAHLEIDSTKTDAAKLAIIEAKLYGTSSEEPTLLLPDEVAEIFAKA